MYIGAVDIRFQRENIIETFHFPFFDSVFQQCFPIGVLNIDIKICAHGGLEQIWIILQDGFPAVVDLDSLC